MPKNNLKSNRVREFADEKGMSATELADLIPCARSCVSRIMNNKAKRLTLQRGMRISEILGQPLNVLFTFESDEKG